MKTNPFRVLVILTLLAGVSHAAPFDTAFTYQGRLADAGQPANGVFDFEFGVWDASTNGSLLGSDSKSAVPVTNGLFTVELDFGAVVFNGNPRWLEIAVRNPALPRQDFVTLTPRTRITPTPYALLSGGVVDGGITTAMLASNSITGNQIAAGAIGTAQIASNSVTAGQLAPGAALENLGGTGFGSVPATSILLSEREVNDSLLNAGFIPLGTQITNRPDAWTAVAPGPPDTGALSFGRYNHAAVWVASLGEMFILGGYPNRNGLRYRLSLNSWTPISSTNAPNLVEDIVAFWTGTRLLAWDTRTHSGGRYNPSNNTWQDVSNVNAPSSR